MRTLVLAGVWLAAITALATGSTVAQLAAGTGSVALCLALYRDRRGLFLGAAALGVLLLAWWRWDAVNAPPPRDSVAWLATEDRRILTGQVVSEPQASGASQRLVVAIDRVDDADMRRSASGSVQVRVAPSIRLRRGDLVRLEGALEPPPVLPGFDYSRYLARRNIFAVMEYPRVRVTGRETQEGVDGLLQGVRDRAHLTLWRNLPAQQASLAEGMLIGRRSDIPHDVNESFQRSGVSHLIVISGFNIALVGGMLMSAAAWVAGRRWAAVVALTGIGAYSLLVGLSPPVARAAVMGSVAIVALLSGRPHGGGAALLLTAAALTLSDPRIVEDISFQLSVAATAGLIVIGSPLQALARRWFVEGEVAGTGTWRSLTLAAWDVLAVTLAATVATLPVMLASFGRLSLVSPLTNLLLVPLFPAVIVSGAIGLTVAMVAPPLDGIALAPVGALLQISIGVARAAASMPGASVNVSWFTQGHVALVYGLLGIAAFGRLPGRRIDPEISTLQLPSPQVLRPLYMIAITPMGILLALLGGALLQRSGDDGRSSVTVLGLAGSSATLVRLGGGGTLLIDTGLAPGAARAALDRELSGGRESLTAVIVTRDAPSARTGLMEVLTRWRAPLVLVPPEAVHSAWATAARDAGATVVALEQDLTLGGAGAHLHVGQSRESEWPLTVRHGNRSIAVGTTDADASLIRTDRVTRVSASIGGTRTVIDLRLGERMTISTDGRGIRLVPPRGRSLIAERCTPSCRSTER